MLFLENILSITYSIRNKFHNLVQYLENIECIHSKFYLLTAKVMEREKNYSLKTIKTKNIGF